MPIRTFGGGVQAALAGRRDEARRQQELEAQIARSEALTGQGERQLELQEGGLEARLLQAALQRQIELEKMAQADRHFQGVSGNVAAQTGTQRDIAAAREAGLMSRHQSTSGDTLANIRSRAALQEDQQAFDAPEQQSRIGLRGVQRDQIEQDMDADPFQTPAGVNALVNLAGFQDVVNPPTSSSPIPFLGEDIPDPSVVSTINRATQLSQGNQPQLGDPVKVDINRPENIQRAQELFRDEGFSPEQIRLLLQDPASIEEILGGQ